MVAIVNGAEWQQLPTATALVIALDLDGTLIPFAPTPQEAVIDDATATLLQAVASAPGVTCGIVSGRPRDLMTDLATRLPQLRLAAEHGVWRFADGRWEAALAPVPQLAEIEQSLAALVRRYPGALIERKSCSVCLHWRRVEPASHDAIANAAEVIVDEWLETHPMLERLPEVEALEVRHLAAHKGSALSWLRARGPAGAMVLAIGDDITDEDMFVSLRDTDVGILVAEAPRRTQARLRLRDPAAVHRFLGWLVDARSSRPVVVPDEIVGAGRPSAPLDPTLVVVSNRLPAATPSSGRHREVGGLVSALMPALADTAGVWLGWSGAERDPGLRVRIDEADTTITRAQFDYPPTWRQRFYAGFCNQSLWPLLHGFPGRVRYVDDEWACYLEANHAYARMVGEVGGAGASVWVQDFQLLMVARELRRAGHRGRIGHYLHVPFPPLDVFETLPWAADLLAGLLDYDIIGVQTQRWAENLMTSITGILGRDAAEKARERIRVIPVGIDPDRIAADAATETPDELALGDRKLILGVDRLDYSKGIPERLEAFARFLERYPEWRNRVSFVQVSVPTRSDVPEYGELRSRVEALVGRINGAHGEQDWVPVRYLYRSYDQPTLARLYRHAAVGFVTPLRDGMNLVAREYVAAQHPDDPGVLVLSKFAGAAERMTDAVLTNPYHVDGVAADLDAALRMPLPERIARNNALRTTVWQDTAATWAKAFLAALKGEL